MNNLGISFIIAAYNAGTTLQATLESILSQDLSSVSNYEIIVVNDCSKDNTLDIATDFFAKNPGIGKVISLEKNSGMSAGNNAGIKIAKYELVALVQADILFESKDAIAKMVKTINDGAIATYPYVLHPLSVWKGYNMWQKALFDRLVNTRSESKFAKLAIINKELVTKVGMYDETLAGGEDTDLLRKLVVYGKIVATDVNVIHIHSNDPKFSIIRLFDKEAQEAEGTGASIKRYGPNKNAIENILILARPIVAISCFIPPFWPIVALFIFMYTRHCYLHAWKSIDILKMPFITIARIYIYSYYLVKGYVTGKTTVRHFKW